jgi:hypothetical protein
MTTRQLQRVLAETPIPAPGRQLVEVVEEARAQAQRRSAPHARSWHRLRLLGLTLVAIAAVAVSSAGAKIVNWVKEAIDDDPAAITAQESIDQGEIIGRAALPGLPPFALSLNARQSAPPCVDFSWTEAGQQVAATPNSFHCDFNQLLESGVSAAKPVLPPSAEPDQPGASPEDSELAIWGLANAATSKIEVEFYSDGRLVHSSEAQTFELPGTNASAPGLAYVDQAPKGLGYLDLGGSGRVVVYDASGKVVATAAIGWVERNGALYECGTVGLSQDPRCLEDSAAPQTGQTKADR